MEKKYYATISARIEVEEKESWEQYCADKDMKVSQLVRKAVKEYMQNHP